MILNVILTFFALCVAVAGGIVAKRKCSDFANKNYVLRTISANVFSSVLIFALLFFGQTIIESVSQLFSELMNGFNLYVLILCIEFLVIVLLSQVGVIIKKRVIFAIGLSALVLIFSAIMIASVEQSELFSMVLVMIIVCGVACLFSIINTLLCIEKKVQKVVLCVFDAIVIVIVAFLAVEFVKAGVEYYSAGILASSDLTGAMFVIVPAALVFIVPALLVAGSIISNFMTSSDK